MKKTITINISGIVFHIEEDGYESLKTYLDGVKKYFLSFKDSQEIITDIESRIAEIFLTRISETKQAITAEDVDHLIRTMGQPSDFTGGEESEESEEQKTTNSGNVSSGTPGPKKKLFRDNRRKVLGGVCAGLAHYFKLDPAWMRLLFTLLILAGGFIIIAYILIWAIVPGSYELEEQTTIKKIYRDGERKVIGGVAGGIAAYIGADISVIRLIFAGLVFAGGFGIIFYIILWIAVPEAVTITEKMEMQGQPVTLSNIEKTVREKLNEKEGKESTLSKIILFPFRLLATMLTAIGSALGPFVTALAKIVRIFTGMILTFIGATFTLTILLLAAILLGVLSTSVGAADWITFSNAMPLEAYQNTFSVWTTLFAALALFIPSLLVALLGLSLIINKSVVNKITGWSMFVIFLISLGVVLFSLPSTILKFSKDGTYKRERVLETGTRTPILRLNDTGTDNYIGASIKLHGHSEPHIRIVERFESQGTTRKEAQSNAQMVDYKIVQKDSLITFDSNITFKKGAAFRAQRLEVDIYFPLNKSFIIEDELWELIRNHGGYHHEDRERNTYTFDEGGLKCLTCEEQNTEVEENENDDYDSDEKAWSSDGQSYNFKNFNEIVLAGYFDADVTRGDKFSIVVEDDEDLRISQEGNKLIVKNNEDKINLLNSWGDKKIGIRITLPKLEKLDAAGAGKFKLTGFRSSNLLLTMSGAIKGEADVEMEDLDLNMVGATKLTLRGKGKRLEANLTGASKLSAENFVAEQGDIDAVGASTAEVNITKSLNSNAMLASRVKNIGSAPKE